MSLSESRILILGKGQLGTEFNRLLPGATWWGRLDLDLSDLDLIELKLSECDPLMIINTAAYTFVDRAEEEANLCAAINYKAVERIASWNVKHNAKLIHFSTDYVFGTDGDHLNGEDDLKNPLNVYGSTKLQGEEAISAIGGNFWIFRISWVFSDTGTNFVKTMIQLFLSRDSVSVVADQFGSPTSAKAIARAVCQLLVNTSTCARNLPVGIYHLRSNTVLNWYDFAKKIFKCASALNFPLKVQHILPIESVSYPTKARRPLNSRLAVDKLLPYLVLPDLDKDLTDVLVSLKGEYEGKK